MRLEERSYSITNSNDTDVIPVEFLLTWDVTYTSTR